jgi:hypothetical protein
MNRLIRSAFLASAAVLLAAPAAWGQFVSPYNAEEGIPTATQIMKDSMAADAIMTSMFAAVSTIQPIGTSSNNLQNGKSDLWFYNAYSPSKRQIITVGLVYAPLLGGFRGSGTPMSIDSVGVGDTVELDRSGAYAASNKIYDQVKTDTAFIRHQQQFPGFQPQYMGLSYAPAGAVPLAVDPSQPFWTIAWAGEGDSNLVCFVASKTGEAICMRVETPASVPMESGSVAVASLAVTPNPASGAARVTVVAPAGAQLKGAELVLFNERGDRVLDLTESFARSGYQYAELDGGMLPAGVYFCRAIGSNWRGVTSLVIQK